MFESRRSRLVACLLSPILCFRLCLVVLLALMLSIHWYPTVEYMMRLVVGSARFPEMGLLACCGPYVGFMVPARAPVWQMGREGTEYC